MAKPCRCATSSRATPRAIWLSARRSDRTRGSHESSAVSRQPSVAAVQNVGGQHSDTGSNRLQALIGSLHRPSSSSNQRILVIAQPVKPELNPPHNELGSRGGCGGRSMSDLVGDTAIDIVADARDDRHPRRGDRPGDPLMIENREISLGTPAASHKQHIDPGQNPRHGSQQLTDTSAPSPLHRRIDLHHSERNSPTASKTVEMSAWAALPIEVTKPTRSGTGAKSRAALARKIPSADRSANSASLLAASLPKV